MVDLMVDCEEYDCCWLLLLYLMQQFFSNAKPQKRAFIDGRVNVLY
jgi:hypothetical protein